MPPAASAGRLKRPAPQPPVGQPAAARPRGAASAEDRRQLEALKRSLARLAGAHEQRKLRALERLHTNVRRELTTAKAHGCELALAQRARAPACASATPALAGAMDGLRALVALHADLQQSVGAVREARAEAKLALRRGAQALLDLLRVRVGVRVRVGGQGWESGLGVRVGGQGQA